MWGGTVTDRQKLGVVVHTGTLALRRVKQEDLKFKPSLDPVSHEKRARVGERGKEGEEKERENENELPMLKNEMALLVGKESPLTLQQSLEAGVCLCARAHVYAQTCSMFL